MSSGTSRQVCIRSDLQQSRQQHQGKSYLVIKDPVARRYFRFTESQASLLDMLATPTTPEAIAERMWDEFHAKVPAETVAAFCDQLENRNLLDTQTVRDRLGVSGSLTKGAKSSMLYRQVASFDPTRLFDWLLPRTRWMFTPSFQVVGCFLIACGVTIFYLHWEELKASTPDLLNVWTVLLAWPVVFSVSAYHEFSHGLTCRHFGGQVKEVGFMLIYFSPAFYCDVSDAWMFPSSRQRMAVTLAGGYSQLILWGVCTIVWWITDPGTVVNHIMVIVVLFSGLQTLFNFNPLIKLDGYYMLSDYLEVPNLRAKSFKALWQRLTRAPDRKPYREERAQIIYGVCALVFSTVLLVTAYSAIYTWATGNWATAGLIGFTLFSAVTLRRTAVESMAGLKAIASHLAVRRYRNGLILLAVLFVAFFVPWELKISAEFTIRAQNEFTVHAETDGVLTEVLVREGSRVHKGDVLARTRDFGKDNEVERISGEIQQKKNVLDRLRAGARPEEITEQQTKIAAKQVDLANVRRNQQERARLTQVIAQRKTQLKVLEDIAEIKRLGVKEGVIPRIQEVEAQNAVDVKKVEITESEAQLKVLDENADREADRLAKELTVLQSGLALKRAGNPPGLIKETQAEISKLEALLASMNLEVGRSEIRAPIDGTVATAFPERMKGQRLAAGKDFLRLVDTGGFIAEMMVPEKELEDVKKGNHVWMTARSFPGVALHGIVESISTVPDNRQMFVVRARIDESSGADLKPDMTGVARIYCGKRRIIVIATRRSWRWFRTDFWHLVP